MDNRKGGDNVDVGDLVTSIHGRVGVVTNIRSNNSADVVWIGGGKDDKVGLANLIWLFLLSKAKK